MIVILLLLILITLLGVYPHKKKITKEKRRTFKWVYFPSSHVISKNDDKVKLAVKFFKCDSEKLIIKTKRLIVAIDVSSLNDLFIMDMFATFTMEYNNLHIVDDKLYALLPILLMDTFNNDLNDHYRLSETDDPNFCTMFEDGESPTDTPWVEDNTPPDQTPEIFP